MSDLNDPRIPIFQEFAVEAEKAGLTAKLCSDDHWQVVGGARIVNVYPRTKRGVTYYVQGTASKVVGKTLKDAILAANKVPNGMVRHAERRKKSSQRRKDRSRRLSLWTKQEGLCQWCKCVVAFSDSTIDHVIPLSKGGSNGTDNLVMSCHPCNQDRKNRISIEELRQTKSETVEVSNG